MKKKDDEIYDKNYELVDKLNIQDSSLSYNGEELYGLFLCIRRNQFRKILMFFYKTKQNIKIVLYMIFPILKMLDF